MKDFSIVRAIARKFDTKSAPSWLLAGHWKLVGCLVLLLSAGISACGTIQAAVPQTQSHLTVTGSPFHTITQTFDKDFTLALTITPDRSGINVFTMQVYDRAGRPASHVEITLYTTMQDMLMGTDSVVLHAHGPGRFNATSDVLNMGGHWAIGITVQTPDHIIHKAGVKLLVLS